MNIALWIVQVLLGLAFIAAGGTKLGTPVEELAKEMVWVQKSPALLVRFVGLSELAGGLGLILPSASRIKPALTPVAASCLVVVMVLAAGTHIVLGEAQMMAPSVVLGGLCAFVAYGRSKLSPIAPKS